MQVCAQDAGRLRAGAVSTSDSSRQAIPEPPLQLLRRAQPPQCTAPPAATAAAGEDGILPQFIPHSLASSADIAA